MTSPHDSDLAYNLARIEERILTACTQAGRPREEVTLVAVSKTFDVPALQQAYALGVRDFGESYVQEWSEKHVHLPADIHWHFIGHMQSNKVKYLGDAITLIHSVSRNSVLKEIAKQMTRPQPILLQFNVGGEEQKSGASPAELEPLLERIIHNPHVTLQGLMTVPPFHDDPELVRPHFKALRDLQRRAIAWLEARDLLSSHPCDQLSMGMSGDFEVAIEEGATIIRVGSAIFGTRDSKA